jgi:hypothetical protein
MTNTYLLPTQDSATLDLITQMVKTHEYMKAPVYLSPYYVKSSILLYHLTRLMGAFKIPELEIYKSQLVEDIHVLLNKSNNIMDQIILRTSLLRLGESAPALDLESINEFEQSNQQQYIFFQARAAFSYPTPLKQIFSALELYYLLFLLPGLQQDFVVRIPSGEK